MRIVYIISKYINFAGAAFKAFWEHFFCRVLHIPVENSQYLKANEVCGHVEHDFSDSKVKTFLIAWLPGLMMSIFSGGFLLSASIGLGFLGMYSGVMGVVYFICLCLGLSFMANMYPLVEDALYNYDLIYKDTENKTNLFVKIILFLPSVFMIIGAYLEKWGVLGILSKAAFITILVLEAF